MSDGEPDGASPEPDEPSESERPRRTVPAGAFALAIVVAAALAVLAVVALSVDGDGTARADDARFAAGRFGERFLNFEHDALAEWKSDVLSLSTGGFADDVEDTEDGLRALLAETEIDARAQVTDVFLGEIDRGTVGAVLVYNRDIVGSQGTRTETDRYMQVQMILVDGEWLVDDVLDISTAGGADQPVEPTTSTPSSTSSTTAPAEPAG